MQLTGTVGQDKVPCCSGKRPIDESGTYRREPEKTKRRRTHGYKKNLKRMIDRHVDRKLKHLKFASLVQKPLPGRRLQIPSRMLRLQIGGVIERLFTHDKVKDKQGLPLHVSLEDVSTGTLVTTEPEASATLEVVVLKGNVKEENWSEDDEVKKRDGKGPLLSGHLKVNLQGGVGTLGELKFTDNSTCRSYKKFRLGVKASPGVPEGYCIQGAKTEPFSVRDRRGKSYQKHERPELDDKVWRLKNIRQGGPFNTRLSGAGIITVGDFLGQLEKNEQKLKAICGSSMSRKNWEGIVKHAQKAHRHKVGKIAHEGQLEKEPLDKMQYRNTRSGGSNIRGSNRNQAVTIMQKHNLPLQTPPVQEEPYTAATTEPSITDQDTLQANNAMGEYINLDNIKIFAEQEVFQAPIFFMDDLQVHSHKFGAATDAGFSERVNRNIKACSGWLMVKVALHWVSVEKAAKRRFWEALFKESPHRNS